MPKNIAPAAAIPFIIGRAKSIAAGNAWQFTPYARVDVARATLDGYTETGDAIFFDDRFVHRTALGPGLSQTRLALESWFFGATSFATEYTSLLV